MSQSGKTVYGIVSKGKNTQTRERFVFVTGSGGDEGTQHRGLGRQSSLKDIGSWFSSLFILSMPNRGSPQSQGLVTEWTSQSGVLVTGRTVRSVQSGLVGNLCIFHSIFLWNKHHFLFFYEVLTAPCKVDQPPPPRDLPTSPSQVLHQRPAAQHLALAPFKHGVLARKERRQCILSIKPHSNS